MTAPRKRGKALTIDARAAESYGALCEGVHVAGYTLERAFGKLEWLLADNARWRSVGGGFTDVNEFMASIKLDAFKGPAEQRKKIAERIKALQPRVSNRQIARTLGVGAKTIDRDVGVASNDARAGKKSNKNKGGSSATASNDAAAGADAEGNGAASATNVAAGMSGPSAAALVKRREEAEARAAIAQQAALDRTRSIEFDARALGKFAVIYADPPWRYEHAPMGGDNRSIERQYPTMHLDEICALPVGDIANDDSVLFLWATSPKLEECMQVINAWGFEHRTTMVWVKDQIGMGYFARQRHELLLIARRGELPMPPPEARPDSVVEAPRMEHSAKPPIFYEIIDRMYPGVRKIELFARGEPRAEWTTWGNQVTDASRS
jgi:N6-adenosine-specific RNA methylase IME4